VNKKARGSRSSTMQKSAALHRAYLLSAQKKKPNKKK
jgi:hypothetical protein